MQSCSPTMHNTPMSASTSAGIRIGTHSPVGGRCRTLRSCSCHSREVVKLLSLSAFAAALVPPVSYTCILMVSGTPVTSHLDPDPIIFGYENRCYDAVSDEPTPSATACIIISASSEVTAPSRSTSAARSISILPTAIRSASAASAVVSKPS